MLNKDLTRRAAALLLVFFMFLSAACPVIARPADEPLPEDLQNTLSELAAQREAILARIALGEPEPPVFAARYAADPDGGTEEEPPLVWDGSAASGFAGGSGTRADPYRISTPSELAYLAATVNAGTTYAGKFIVLTDDIYLNDVTDWQLRFEAADALAPRIGPDPAPKEGAEPEEPEETAPVRAWTPAGYYVSNQSFAMFRGNFNGQNHTVHGLYLNTASDYVGLFGYVYDGTVQNVSVTESRITAGSNAGAVAGRIVDGMIVHCFASGYLFGLDYLGGVAGYIGSGIASLCASNGRVNGRQYVGGVFGASGGDVMLSYFTGRVTGTTYVGGLIGWKYATGTAATGLSDCYSAGSVTAQNYAGGIAGYLHADAGASCTVSHCYNAGSVAAASGGALVGYHNGSLARCLWRDDAAFAIGGGIGSVTDCPSCADADLMTDTAYRAAGFDFVSTWSAPIVPAPAEETEGSEGSEDEAEAPYPYATLTRNEHRDALADPVLPEPPAPEPTYAVTGLLDLGNPLAVATLTLAAQESADEPEEEIPEAEEEAVEEIPEEETPVEEELPLEEEIPEDEPEEIPENEPLTVTAGGPADETAENGACPFAFPDVTAGVYTLTVTAPGFLPVTVTGITVTDADVDLSVLCGTLKPHPGDINGDGFIDSLDITLFMSDMGLTDADAASPLTDLNGDSYRDALDVTALSYHLLTTPTVIALEAPVEEPDEPIEEPEEEIPEEIPEEPETEPTEEL